MWRKGKRADEELDPAAYEDSDDFPTALASYLDRLQAAAEAEVEAEAAAEASKRGGKAGFYSQWRKNGKRSKVRMMHDNRDRNCTTIDSVRGRLVNSESN